jgi:bleomycin hydrolase
MGSQSSKEVEYNEKADSTEVLTSELANLDLEGCTFSENLTIDALARYSKSFNQDSKNLLARNAIVGNDPTQILVNPKAALSDKHIFNIKLELEGSATNQKSSGRCWLFAGCNVMRLSVIQKYKLNDDFELSQSYLFFYGNAFFFCKVVYINASTYR